MSYRCDIGRYIITFMCIEVKIRECEYKEE
jgi:hypothetical protein